MTTLLFNPLQIVTVNTNKKNYKNGSESKEVGILLRTFHFNSEWNNFRNHSK